MKDQNKPDWLIKAEKEQAKFNETKWAKYTDSQIDMVIGGATALPRYDSEYQKVQGIKGGAVRAKLVRDRQIAEMGYDGYCKWKKENGYDKFTDEKKKEFHSLGGVTTSENKRIARDILLLPFVDFIPKDIWIKKSEIIKAFEGCEVNGAVHKFMCYHQDKFSTNGARGTNVRYLFETKGNA